MGTSARDEYLRNAVLTASPAQLQLMLYDGAIRFASQGRDAVAAGRIEDGYNALTRAQRIVLELESGMRPEIAPEICKQMSGLYNFVYRQLVDGCVRRDVAPVDEALKILRYQRETWVLLMEKLRGGAVEAGRPPAGAPQEQASVGLVVEG